MPYNITQNKIRNNRQTKMVVVGRIWLSMIGEGDRIMEVH